MRLIHSLIVAAALAGSAHAQTGKPPILRAAVPSPEALHSPLIAFSCAGARQVAVGDRGVVLLSDDQGGSWRQARSVPAQVMLTAVTFVDAQRGWAVGHRGVVLHTQDGGETWQLQRHEPEQDRPLFAVHFFDASQGVAVGLWSQVLTTTDGGRQWQTQHTGLSRQSGNADLNLFSLFPDAQGRLYSTSERGQLLRSTDRGQHWELLSTGSAASLWTGLALPTGRLIVAGLRGALLRSDDEGRSWQAQESGPRDSLHALTADPRGQDVLAVGASGAVLRSRDGGERFMREDRPERLPLMAVGRCAPAADWQLLGARGPQRLPAASPASPR